MNSPIKIIGISGTNGSGKDTLGHFLAGTYNYLFISVTDILRGECRRRGISVSRENLRMISAEWRRESGLGVLVDKAVSEYEKVEAEYSGLAIASLRNPGEADRVHELNGLVVWLDSNPKMRYERILSSPTFQSTRSDEFPATFEDFLSQEKAEMTHSGDEATLSMSLVKGKADIVIINDFDDINLFEDKVAGALNL
jgi:cytidylate kinase